MVSILRRAAGLVLALAVVGGNISCSGQPGDGQPGDAEVTLSYWLWDDRQVPAYQACAKAFHDENPKISVAITQTAFSKYWTNLSTQLTAGDAPDVWTDDGFFYPQYVLNNQILDIQPYVDRDRVDLGQYKAGLADLWVKDGKRYGLPKDWDTVALVYNRRLVDSTAIGSSGLSWNPTDGGSFERLIAAATVDKNGHNGLDPAFDKEQVKVYGFLPEWTDGSRGQNGWGNFAASNGFIYMNQNPWGTHYNYDDPRLAQTITWLKRLIDKGYAPPLDKQSTLSRQSVMQAGKAAITIAGSWETDAYLGKAGGQQFEFAQLPAGPQGRKSAMNSLSDAIWSGSRHPDQAWAWVKFLASPACQNLVAEQAVVFPAITSATEKAVAAYRAKGQDVHVFTDSAAERDGTFLLPVSDQGLKIWTTIQDAIQAVALGQGDAETLLTKANGRVNALFR